ncbi:MAG: hypothetical protein MJ002_02025 [Paludibacteraceae bacterium]|nr:hypothetical protein [Paludibacteraceae bacterium]
MPSFYTFHKLNILISLLLAFILSSCAGSGKTVTAEGLLDNARRLEKKDPQAALLTLDSIHESFPRDIKSRRQADTIEWRIELIQAITSLPHVDSMLRVDSAKLEKIKVNFNYSPASEYQDIGIWEHRVFRTENNTSRNYLKPTVNDNGDIVLISFYVGREAVHTTLTISIDGMERHTGVADDVSSFNDGGVFHEFLSFNDDLETGITAYITDTDGEKVTVMLRGENDYSYDMNSRDREAFGETMKLAVLLHEIHEFATQQTKFSRQIELLNQRLYNTVEHD